MYDLSWIDGDHELSATLVGNFPESKRAIIEEIVKKSQSEGWYDEESDYREPPCQLYAIEDRATDLDGDVIPGMFAVHSQVGYKEQFWREYNHATKRIH